MHAKSTANGKSRRMSWAAAAWERSKLEGQQVSKQLGPPAVPRKVAHLAALVAAHLAAHAAAAAGGAAPEVTAAVAASPAAAGGPPVLPGELHPPALGPCRSMLYVQVHRCAVQKP